MIQTVRYLFGCKFPSFKLIGVWFKRTKSTNWSGKAKLSQVKKEYLWRFCFDVQNHTFISENVLFESRKNKGLFKCLEEIKVGQKDLKEKANQLLLIHKVNDDQNLSDTAPDNFSFSLKIEDDLQWLENCGVKMRMVCFIAAIFIRFFYRDVTDFSKIIYVLILSQQCPSTWTFGCIPLYCSIFILSRVSISCIRWVGENSVATLVRSMYNVTGAKGKKSIQTTRSKRSDD